VFEAILHRSPGQHGMHFIDQACKSTWLYDLGRDINPPSSPKNQKGDAIRS